MEYRKIQKIGGSSYSITLPKEWVEEKGLKEGSTVFMEITKNRDILILSENKKEDKMGEYNIQLKDFGSKENILRKIISVYLSGVERIVISSDQPLNDDVRQAAEMAKKLLIGIEIMEETSSRLVMQDLSKVDELPMDRMLSRLFYMSGEMLKDTKKIVMNMDKKMAKEVMERDLQIDRIFLLISKQFYQFLKSPEKFSKLNITLLEAFHIRTVAKYLERICDHAEKIASTIHSGYLEGFDNSTKEIFSSWFDRIIGIFENSMKSFNSHDEELANSTIYNVNAVCSEIDETIGTLKIDEPYIIFRLGEDLVRIAKYSSDICETSINHLIMTGENLFTE